MPLFVGQLLNNRYRIDALLGQGGFGAVYRAFDVRLNIVVAVKENLDPSPEAERQFMREAQVLAQVSHPNLPRVTDHFVSPGQGQYLVMDFVDGEDLESMRTRLGVLPKAQVLPWLQQVCDALTYLHHLHPPIIHRDIKPANIRIRPDGRALLVDFGIAKLYNPNQATTSAAKAVTPGYSPPEQYSGHTDARSDVYALGATFYSLLTGRELPESVLRVAHQQMLLKPRQINSMISESVDQAIVKAVELDTGRRFQSVADFSQELKRQSVTQRLSDAPSWRRRRYALWVGLGIFALGMLMVFLIGIPQGKAQLPAESLPPTAAAGSVETATVSASTVSSQPSVQATSTLRPTTTASSTLAPVQFERVALGLIANASLSSDYGSPPLGAVDFNGLPFTITGEVFKTQASPKPNNTFPARAVLTVNVSHVERIGVVLTAGNGFTRWQGKTVGRITLVFDGAPDLTVDLILGQNIREWHAAQNVVSSASDIDQVWQGEITGKPGLYGYLDLLETEVPVDRRSAALKSIVFEDLSRSTVNSLDPALAITAVTIAHR